MSSLLVSSWTNRWPRERERASEKEWRWGFVWSSDRSSLIVQEKIYLCQVIISWSCLHTSSEIELTVFLSKAIACQRHLSQSFFLSPQLSRTSVSQLTTDARIWCKFLFNWTMCADERVSAVHVSFSNWRPISMVNWSIGNSSSFTLDPCARVNCNHGRCELDRNAAVCRCYAGFTGHDCLTPLGRFGVFGCAFAFLSLHLSLSLFLWWLEMIFEGRSLH